MPFMQENIQWLTEKDNTFTQMSTDVYFFQYQHSQQWKKNQAIKSLRIMVFILNQVSNINYCHLLLENFCFQKTEKMSSNTF